MNTIVNNSIANRTMTYLRMRYNVTDTYYEEGIQDEPCIGMIYRFSNNTCLDAILYSYQRLYLLSKAGILFAISAFQMLVFVLIGSFILEIQGMIWRYFLILFTAAAWANIIGLNISSGFKSVVTIYAKLSE